MERFFRLNKFCLFTVAVIALVSTGYVAAGQAYDVNVTPNTALKLSNPGEIVTHVFTIKNEGTSSDTYELSLGLPEDWTSLPITDQLNVAAGDNKPVFVNVNVPKDAKSGKYQAKLTARSTGDPTVEASDSAEIQVKSVPGFDLAWEVEPSRVRPGMTVSGKFKITNDGNLPDSYEIEAEVPNGWNYSLEQDEVQFMPGQSKILNVTFTAPKGVRSGERYSVEIKVTSKHDRELKKTIRSTGQYAPPPPDEVPSSLYPSWDVFTNVNMNQEGDPSFYVSGRGEIPQLGDISANINYSVEGFESGSLRIMKDRWGFVLNSSSISGSYLSTSGTPLFIAEMEDASARFLYTEESKGVSLEKEGDYWDLRAILGKDTTDQDYTFQELQGAYEFSNGVVLDGLITTAETQTDSGTIYGAGLEMSSEKLEIYTSFLIVRPGYPNQAPRQEAGADISFEEEEFTSYFNWDYTKTRLGEPPDYYHSAEQDFDVSTTLDLGENLNSDFSLGFTRRITNDEPITNDLLTSTFSGSISGGDILTWSLGAGYTRTQDFVSDTLVSSHSVDGSLGFTIGETEHSVGLNIRQTEGPSGTTTSNTFSLRSELTDFPLSPIFSLSRGAEDTMLYANFSEQSAEGGSLDISFSASLVQQDTVSLSISSSFPDPFRCCGPSKGQPTGYVFLDENGNGRKDSGEEGIQGVSLSMNGEEALTSGDGRFAFPSVPPGEYLLAIEGIRAGLQPTIATPVTVKVKAGERPRITIPVRPRSWIQCTVYRDRNQNKSRDGGEEGLGGIIFTVTGEGISREIRSGSNGRFVIDLPPGTYTVKLMEDSLPERFEPTTASTVNVTTERYGRVEASFGVYRKPRPVEVTFGPPTAKFTYNPAEPDIGQEILLDGSDSSAIETEIASYEWKLTHAEREITRSGEKFRIRLPEAGKWEVSLTVTDKNGLKGKTVKTIMVSP